MPTYTYKCKKCGADHDVFHAMSAAPKVACPECGGACVKQLGTGSGIIFKGSGFYETDYKKKSGGGPAKEGAAASAVKTDGAKADGAKAAPAAKTPEGGGKKKD